jgi:hypothetical protein
MGFSGGGSNTLKPHTHDSNVLQDGGALQFAGVTQGTLSANSMTYSDGNNLQELSTGVANQALIVGPTGVPTWTNLDVEQLYLALQNYSKTFETGFQSGTVTSSIPTGSSWTFTNVAGTTTNTMVDGTAGGFRMTTDTTAATRGGLSNNDIRNFNPTDSTVYGIFSFDNTATFVTSGLSDNVNTNTTSTEYAAVNLDTTLTNVALASCDGTTLSKTETDIALSTDPVIYRLVLGSANLKLYLYISDAWVLKVTKTTNRPTAALMPNMFIHNRTGGSTRYATFQYYKVINNAVL